MDRNLVDPNAVLIGSAFHDQDRMANVRANCWRSRIAGWPTGFVRFRCGKICAGVIAYALWPRRCDLSADSAAPGRLSLERQGVAARGYRAQRTCVVQRQRMTATLVGGGELDSWKIPARGNLSAGL